MLADHLFMRGHSQIHNLLVGSGAEGFLEPAGDIGVEISTYVIGGGCAAIASIVRIQGYCC